jgi:hypothetical protein
MSIVGIKPPFSHFLRSAMRQPITSVDFFGYAVVELRYFELCYCVIF